MKLTCKDIDPTSTCNFVAEGASASEVAKKMMDHAKTDHSDTVAGKSDEDLMSMMESKVHE